MSNHNKRWLICWCGKKHIGISKTQEATCPECQKEQYKDMANIMLKRKIND